MNVVAQAFVGTRRLWRTFTRALAGIMPNHVAPQCSVEASLSVIDQNDIAQAILLFAAVHRRIHGGVIVLRVALDMRRNAGLFQQRPERVLQLFDVIPHETLD